MTAIRPPRSPHIMSASIIFCTCCVSHALHNSLELSLYLFRHVGTARIMAIACMEATGSDG